MLDQFKIEFHYDKRARRATMRLKPDKLIRVSIPYGVDGKEIKNWIMSKSVWILEKYRAMESVEKKHDIKFIHGEKIPFHGKNLKLTIISAIGPIVKKEDEIIVAVPANETEKKEFVRAALAKWYKAQALEQIKQRVSYFTALVDVSAKSIAIKNYKSRWGACSSKGDLIFNWQIIAFEPRLFDYVIAHEVCHLKEMAHNRKFYHHLAQLGFDKKEIHAQFKHLKNIF